MQIKNIAVSHRNRTIDATYYKPDGEGSFPLVIFSHGYNGHKEDAALSAKYYAKAESVRSVLLFAAEAREMPVAFRQRR